MAMSFPGKKAFRGNAAGGFPGRGKAKGLANRTASGNRKMRPGGRV